jgi:hypothetical protein
MMLPACPFRPLVRTAGGKGTPRRKVVKKSVTATQGDDRKVQAALKKLGVQPITGVEEVNMFKEDGNVLHFSQPRGECWRTLVVLNEKLGEGRAAAEVMRRWCNLMAIRVRAQGSTSYSACIPATSPRLFLFAPFL